MITQAHTLEHLFGRLPNVGGFMRGAPVGPATDIIQPDENSCVILMALPGFALEDIQIHQKGQHLAVKAQREPQERDRFHLSPVIACRHAARAFHLPADASVKDAVLKDGLLEITVSLNEVQTEGERIEVKSAKR